MATISPNTHLNVNQFSPGPAQAASYEEASGKLDPRLKQIKKLVDLGDYERALNAVPTNNSDAEVVNTRAVCLLRLGKFSQAIAPLRSLALSTSTFHLRPEAPEHIKINYALALFFGGEAAGGLESLSDINREDDPQVKIIREQAKVWTASMNWWRRFDWYVNRIAPPHGPTPPAQPLGYFAWQWPGDQRLSRMP